MTQMIEQIQNAMLPNTQHFNAIVSPEYCSTKSAMDSDGSCHSAYVPYTARAAVNTLDTTMNDIFTCAAYCRIPHDENCCRICSKKTKQKDCYAHSNGFGVEVTCGPAYSHARP